MALEKVWACDTITGARKGLIQVSSFPWDKRMNEASSSQSIVIPARANAAQGVNVHQLITSRSTTLVYEDSRGVVAARIVDNPEYDWTTGDLTVATVDLWDVLAGRLAVQYGSALVTSKLTYQNITWGTLASALIRNAMPSMFAGYALPIVTPDSVPGTGWDGVRTYYGYEIPNLVDALRDIMEVEGGPDIDFHPRWAGGFVPDATGGFYTAGALVWDARIGDLNRDTQVLSFHLDADDNGLTGLKYAQDGARVVTNAYAVGEGSEKKLLVRSARNTAPTVPAVDRVVARKSEKSTQALLSIASEALRVSQTPTRQLTLTMPRDLPPQKDIIPTHLRLGDRVKIINPSDPGLPGGTSVWRVIQTSGDIARTDVTVVCQPV